MRHLGISANSCLGCGSWSTYILEILEGGMERVGCDCGHEAVLPHHQGFSHLCKVDKTRYPYVSGSLGEVVTSKDHEHHVAKQKGMVPTTNSSVDGRRAKQTRRKLFRPAKV